MKKVIVLLLLMLFSVVVNWGLSRTAVKKVIVLLLLMLFLVMMVNWELNRDSSEKGHCSVAADVVFGGGELGTQ